MGWLKCPQKRYFLNGLLFVWWTTLLIIFAKPKAETISLKESLPQYTESERDLLKQQSCVRSIRPCPRLKLNRSEDYLVDLPNFQYVLKSIPCNGKESVVVLVHSAPNHFEERSSIRSTWGKGSRYLKDFTIKFVFLVALTTNETLNERLFKEHEFHSDLVQGNFIDSYRNLTYKHIMGLKWAWEYCSQVKTLMKIDDDIFVHLFNFHKLLRSIDNNEHSLVCYVQKQMPVTRDEGSKWMVTVPEYPLYFYEEYCSGWAYFLTPDIARRLYLESRYRPFFWVDDVHVTGTLAKMAGVGRIKINKHFTTEAESTTTWARSSINKEWNFVFGPTWGDPHLVHEAHRKVLDCRQKRCTCCYNLFTVKIEETQETIHSKQKGKAQVISIN